MCLKGSAQLENVQKIHERIKVTNNMKKIFDITSTEDIN